jgi:O-succinylbenzoic acid--CoA ligase
LLPDWLARRAADRPAAPALIAGERIWTYADLDTAASMLARTLAVYGIGEGDRVAMLLRNGTHVACVVHALIRLGAVLLPLNVRLAPAELAWQIRHASVTLVLHDARTATLATDVGAHWEGAARCTENAAMPPSGGVGKVPAPALLQVDPAEGNDPLPFHLDRRPQVEPAAPPVPPRERINLDAVHCVIYTSGTTGRPKGVLLSYGNHWWAAIGSALNLGLSDDDRWLACLPLFHIGGLSILLRAAIYGIPVIFPERPEAPFDAAAVNQAIAATRTTIISVVSTQLQRLLDAGLAGADAGGTLRCVLLGGGPAPLPLLQECARRGIPVVQSYGLTETCSQAATLVPAEALRKLGSAGRPLLPTEVRIAPLDPDGAGQASTEDPDVGEILVRGPTVTPGYLPPEEMETVPAVDADGWLHTGDIGYLDREGYLYVLDRRSDMIISGGENVYPAEVEAVLLAHPAVADAGVYPLPHPIWGQAVAAAIVLRPDTPATPDAIITFARERLARYKVPSHLEVRGALPRNAAGKLVRRELAPAERAPS